MKKESLEKIAEYMGLLKKSVTNIDKITEGLINDIILRNQAMDDNKTNEILRRRQICKGCPYMSENAKTSEEYKDLVGYNYSSDRPDEHCSLCGCNVVMKTACLSCNCGIETWNKYNPDKQLTLKWEAYDNDKKS